MAYQKCSFDYPIFDCMGLRVEIDADFYDGQPGEGEARRIVFEVDLVHRRFRRLVKFEFEKVECLAGIHYHIDATFWRTHFNIDVSS